MRFQNCCVFCFKARACDMLNTFAWMLGCRLCNENIMRLGLRCSDGCSMFWMLVRCAGVAVEISYKLF